MKQMKQISAIAGLAMVLGACGGGSGDHGATSTTTPVSTSSFKQQASWSFALPAAGSSLCYDFDAAQQSSCTGTNWDLKVSSGGSTATFWTNGGVSGSGQGAAFGLFDWSSLQKWTTATTDPDSKQDVSALYFKDTASSIFSTQSWYAYDLLGTHQLHPNYRVYLIDSDTSNTAAAVYALQVIGYYGGAGGTTSGYPTIRWIDRSAPADVRTQTINATDTNKWVYFDLKNGTVVDLSDADAATSSAWQIAFNRSNIKLNGGSSGSAKVAGFLGKTPAGFYDASGNPVTSKFTSTTPADTLGELTASDMQVPANSSQWVKDSITSTLNPAYTGTYPAPLDFGWYTYYPVASTGHIAHSISANTGKGALLRAGEGKSYARFHVSNIQYADATNAGSQTTWTLEFDVQPAAN